MRSRTTGLSASNRLEYPPSVSDPLSVKDQKSLLRKNLRQKLAELAAEEKLRRSQKIQQKLFEHARFQAAKTLVIYLALESEVDTKPVVEEALKQGKKVYVPLMGVGDDEMAVMHVDHLNGLKPGAWGTPEPEFEVERVGSPADLELVVIPGLGFDRKGARLGRGKGHFDRFLAKTPKAYKIGLAFECQVLDQIPQEPNDISVDEVITG